LSASTRKPKPTVKEKEGARASHKHMQRCSASDGAALGNLVKAEHDADVPSESCLQPSELTKSPAKPKAVGSLLN
jgi:hypothetical protein